MLFVSMIIVVIINAGKLYGVVLCCRPRPVNHTFSQNVGGRCRRTASSSVGGFPESTKHRPRWSRFCRRQQSGRFQEAAPLTGGVQATTADTSLSGPGRHAPVTGLPPADRHDRRQVIGLGCWPRSDDNVKFQDSYI